MGGVHQHTITRLGTPFSPAIRQRANLGGFLAAGHSRAARQSQAAVTAGQARVVHADAPAPLSPITGATNQQPTLAAQLRATRCAGANALRSHGRRQRARWPSPLLLQSAARPALRIAITLTKHLGMGWAGGCRDRPQRPTVSPTWTKLLILANAMAMAKCPENTTSLA